YQHRVLPESVRQTVIDTGLAGNGNILVVRSLDRDQRNRQQGREDAQRFPAGKAFVEDHSGQNNRDHRIERTQHDGRVQATGLFSSDEERSATDVEQSSEQGEGGAGRLQIAAAPAKQDDGGHNQQ